jgi:hypothetical protein
MFDILLCLSFVSSRLSILLTLSSIVNANAVLKGFRPKPANCSFIISFVTPSLNDVRVTGSGKAEVRALFVT